MKTIFTPLKESQKLKPSREFVEKTRSRLLHHYAFYFDEDTAPAPTYRYAMGRVVLLAAFLIILIIGGAWDALPGEVFYPVKVAGERFASTVSEVVVPRSVAPSTKESSPAKQEDKREVPKSKDTPAPEKTREEPKKPSMPEKGEVKGSTKPDVTKPGKDRSSKKEQKKEEKQKKQPVKVSEQKKGGDKHK